MRRILWSLRYIWPPIAALQANSQLKKQMAKELGGCEDYQNSVDKWLKAIGERVSDTLVRETENIENREIQRKDVIEAKASSLTMALGISTTLLVIVPAVIGKDWGLPVPVAWAVASILILTIVHFLVAAYFSIKVASVAAFFVVSANTMDTLLQKQGDQTDRSWILATKLANIEMNIPTVIVKTNYLAVSQALFLRGILFLGLAASTALISKVVTG